MSEEAENNLFNQVALDVERYGKCADVELKAGEFSMYSNSCCTAPSQSLNTQALRSDAIAPSTFGRYRDSARLTRASSSHGEDPTNHWGNPPRPTRDLITT